MIPLGLITTDNNKIIPIFKNKTMYKSDGN